MIETYRRELTAFCYRMLASPFDAGDAVQETFVRATKAGGSYEERGEMRAWLYRIATNVCLDMLKSRERRTLPMEAVPAAGKRRFPRDHDIALGEPRPEATWVQPVPDALVLATRDDPAETAVERESVRLAFISALQLLQPRQRAVLILRDVLEWSASEVAVLLDMSVDAVNSSVRRARDAVNEPAKRSLPLDGDEQRLFERYVDAFIRYDVPTLVSLLREDATLTMPPFELWLQGVETIGSFLAAMDSAAGHDKVVPVRANGCPALAVYRFQETSGRFEKFQLQIIEMDDGSIAAIHAFLDPVIFEVFDVPDFLE